MALFKSPSDRKQIGIIAERMFDKNRTRFMSAYFHETERAFGSIFVDIAQTRRVISKYRVTFSALVVDIRLLTAPQNRSKQSKRPITRKTFPAKLD